MNNNIDTESWVEDFVSDLVEYAGLDVSIEELDLDTEDNLVVQLSGPDSARAIGREGQVLEAIQHLVITAAIHSNIPKRRIVIDIERYRERREQKIQDDAAYHADGVVDSGKPYDLPPMTPRERRLVHMTIAEMDGVRTESVGSGEERFVRILPE